MKRLLALCLFACLLTGCASQPVVDQTVSAEPPVEQNKIENDEPEVSLDDCLAYLEAAVAQVYENHELHLSDDKKDLLVYVWQDGLAEECVKAKHGISPYAESWEEIKYQKVKLKV